MTAIAAASAPTLPPAVITPSSERTAAVPAAPIPRADQPAVINDVASQAVSGTGAMDGELLTGTTG